MRDPKILAIGTATPPHRFTAADRNEAASEPLSNYGTNWGCATLIKEGTHESI